MKGRKEQLPQDSNISRLGHFDYHHVTGPIAQNRAIRLLNQRPVDKFNTHTEKKKKNQNIHCHSLIFQKKKNQFLLRGLKEWGNTEAISQWL